MIRPEDFQVRIDYDEAGPLVIVGHEISGIERRARPTSLESVGQIRARLLAEIEREFYDPSEIRINHVHRGRGDEVVGSMQIVHLPTGIYRWRPSEGEGPMAARLFEAIDEVVAEVWRRKVEDANSD